VTRSMKPFSCNSRRARCGVLGDVDACAQPAGGQADPAVVAAVIDELQLEVGGSGSRRQALPCRRGEQMVIEPDMAGLALAAACGIMGAGHTPSSRAQQARWRVCLTVSGVKGTVARRPLGALRRVSGALLVEDRHL
jgi:hypothetical protein